MKLTVLIRVLAVLGGGWFSLSNAASLQMYPVTLNFCNGETARPIYIKNSGAGPIGVQMRLYSWQQKYRKDVLTPTGMLISSPPVASIPAGKQQLARIISLTGSISTEQSFRLIVDELPGEVINSMPSQIKFLLRYSVPVFFSCKDDKTDISAIHASLDTHGSRARLIVRNSGPRHIKLSNVALVSSGKSIIINRGLMGYVLPHSEMAWNLPEDIRSGASLLLTINDNETNKSIPLKN